MGFIWISWIIICSVAQVLAPWSGLQMCAEAPRHLLPLPQWAKQSPRLRVALNNEHLLFTFPWLVPEKLCQMTTCWLWFSHLLCGSWDRTQVF